MNKFAFDVPTHERMLIRCTGVMPQTVLTIEQMLYTWRLCEYNDLYSIRRLWCYDEMSEALAALFTWLRHPERSAPAGWIRAVGWEADGSYHSRRVRVVDGERVIYEEAEDE